jgi:hypothetical protein
VTRGKSGTPVSSTNKTDRHDIAEIVLKVVLNTNSNPETVIQMYDCQMFLHVS